MKRRGGFTLTEMMFVVAIIAILAGIGYPLGVMMLGSASNKIRFETGNSQEKKR